MLLFGFAFKIFSAFAPRSLSVLRGVNLDLARCGVGSSRVLNPVPA
jgi:hypothetical protein